MPVSPEIVDQLAEYTRLHLEQEEKEQLVEYLNRQLVALALMSEAGTGGVEPLANVLMEDAPLRKDQVRPSLPVDDALANAPDRFGSFFRVPPMMGAEH